VAVGVGHSRGFGAWREHGSVSWRLLCAQYALYPYVVTRVSSIDRAWTRYEDGSGGGWWRVGEGQKSSRVAQRSRLGYDIVPVVTEDGRHMRMRVEGFPLSHSGRRVVAESQRIWRGQQRVVQEGGLPRRRIWVKGRG
jgi:hypothetical protein